VDGEAITASKALKLFYRLGTVRSANDGVLRSFSNQAVVEREAP